MILQLGLWNNATGTPKKIQNMGWLFPTKKNGSFTCNVDQYWVTQIPIFLGGGFSRGLDQQVRSVHQHTRFFFLVLWTQKGVLLINTNIRGLWIKMGPPKAWVSILKMVQLLDDLGCPKTSGNLLFNRRVSLIYHQRFWSTPSFFCFKSGTLTGWWCNNHLEKYESQWEGWHPIYYGK